MYFYEGHRNCEENRHQVISMSGQLKPYENENFKMNQLFSQWYYPTNFILMLEQARLLRSKGDYLQL